MSQQNSLAPFTKASIKDLLDTIGITQFTSETDWYQVIAGLIVQGGFVETITTGDTITFNTSFTKQVLGIFVTAVGASSRQVAVDTITVDDFVLRHNGGGTGDFYWFAIGV